MRYSFVAVYFECIEGGYGCYVEELPGVHAQGETIEEARAHLRDAIALVLACNRRDTWRLHRELVTALREPITVTTPRGF